jgi:hypothetical protein
VRRIELDLQDGPGGWVEAVVHSEGEYHGPFYVRFRPDGQDGWKPQGTLHVRPLSPETLRAVPLKRIVLAVEASEPLRNALARRFAESVPEVGSDEFDALWAQASWIHEEPPLILERPKGRALPDEFFAKVAETYRAATIRGWPPRTAVAEAAGVSTDVAGRWVREARKRKYLPATKQGRVTV